MQSSANNYSSINSSRLFFILSGEHSSLPIAEIEAILESEQLEFTRSYASYRLLILQASPEALQLVSQRSLMYDQCGLQLGQSSADENEIVRLVRSLPLEKICAGSENFAIRSVRLGGVNKRIKRTVLEKQIGAMLKDQVPRLKVNLTKPELTFLCVIHEDSIIFGILTHLRPTGPISLRRPRKRPVFHPATMQPKIARCMVNLSRARPGKTFADPFCGVRGIVIEASLIGCDVLGVDANPRMLRCVRRNVRYFGLPTFGLIIGDARRLPFHGLDAIATDPPYGRDSSTRGLRLHDLLKEFLAGAPSSMKPGASLCVSAPSDVDLSSLTRDAGFKLKESYLIRIHRSLTRQFVVARN